MTAELLRGSRKFYARLIGGGGGLRVLLERALRERGLTMRNQTQPQFPFRGVTAGLLAIALTVALGDRVDGQPATGSVAFVNVTVIDGTGAVKRDQTVLTSDGRIT